MTDEMFAAFAQKFINRVPELVKDIETARREKAEAEAYDGYATQAMQSLISSYGEDDCSDEEDEAIRAANPDDPDTAVWKEYASHISGEAWRIADAMMEERKKRGIGQNPTSPTLQRAMDLAAQPIYVVKDEA